MLRYTEQRHGEDDKDEDLELKFKRIEKTERKTMKRKLTFCSPGSARLLELRNETQNVIMADIGHDDDERK